jgi:hypothetical protein
MMAQASRLAQAASFAPGSPAALNYLNQLLVQRGVDPAAANAVFSQEGASGGIGDGGHAFGPGQFNDAGGVWTGKYPGLTPEQKNQIAWSPAGLADLASHVGAVAGGLHGPAAVTNIVSRFERPADIPGEISRALEALGAKGPTGPDIRAGLDTPTQWGGGRPVPMPAPAPPTKNSLAAAAAPANPARANAARLQALALNLLRA